MAEIVVGMIVLAFLGVKFPDIFEKIARM